MLSICKNDYYYRVTPRIVCQDKITQICIRPLDFHAAFEENKVYRVCVIPLTSDVYTASRPPIFETTVVCRQGELRFSHAFVGEQEHFIRLYRENETACLLQTSVYSLQEDLFSRRPYLGDFHVHSCFSDGRESPEFVAAMYRQAGYDFIAITDHGRMDSSLRAIQTYQGIPLDFTLYPGEEVHPPHSHVHILNIGGAFSVNERCLTENNGRPWGNPGRTEWLRAVEKRAAALTDISPDLDPFVHATCLQVIDSIHEAGGMAVLCHPFWLADVHNLTNEFTAQYIRKGYADALELIGGLSNHENMMQIAFYQQLLSEGCRVPVVGTSDSHGTVDRLGFDGTKSLILAKGNSKEDMMEAVCHQYSVAMDEYDGQEPRYYSSFRMVSYAMFLYEHYFPLHRELCYEEGRLMRELVAGDTSAAAQLSLLAGRTTAHRERFFAQYGDNISG